jgi:hypothetical protein
MASNGSSSHARFCAHCGNALSGAFCSACGAAAPTPESIAITHDVPRGSDGGGLATAPTQVLVSPVLPVNGDGNGAPHPSEPPATRDRRRVLIAAGAITVVLVAAAVVAAVTLLGGGDSATRSRTTLRDALRVAQPALAGANGATRLADVQAAGRLASAQAETMATQTGVASAISDARFRRATTAMIRAERAYLSDLARTASLSETNLDTWPALKQTLQRDSISLTASRPAVVALKLHSALPLTVTPASSAAAIASLDHVISHADSALTAWRSQTHAAHARNHRAMAGVVSYATTMHGYLSQYDSLRNDMSDWVDKVDTEGATFDEAYQFLGDATTARQSLKDTISHLQAPTTALAAAQSRVEQVLADSIQAMDDAQSGISDYQFSSDYTNYKDTPGWRQFQSESSKISDELGAAGANLEQQIAARQKAVRNHGLPPKPEV